MERKLAAVVTCVDSKELAEESLYYLRENTTPELTEIILVDNGSFTPLPKYSADRVIRYEENIGVNAVFHRTIPELEAAGFTHVAHMHCDVMIREKEWDDFLMFAFKSDPKLALVGLLGSNEIDAAGGRGLGTASSFFGGEYNTGWASKAEIHGRRVKGKEAAAVVDHLFMSFPLEKLKQLPPQEESGYAPHHFYDRILSCEVLSRDWHIALLGLDADHFGGGTGLCKVPHEGPELGVLNRDKLYRRWLTEQKIPFATDADNLDYIVYVEAEKIFLKKWRDESYFIPVKVLSDYSLYHSAKDHRINVT